jgi:hypothetical protein
MAPAFELLVDNMALSQPIPLWDRRLTALNPKKERRCCLGPYQELHACCYEV